MLDDYLDLHITVLDSVSATRFKDEVLGLSVTCYEVLSVVDSYSWMIWCVVIVRSYWNHFFEGGAYLAHSVAHLIF